MTPLGRVPDWTWKSLGGPCLRLPLSCRGGCPSRDQVDVQVYFGIKRGWRVLGTYFTPTPRPVTYKDGVVEGRGACDGRWVCDELITKNLFIDDLIKTGTVKKHNISG